MTTPANLVYTDIQTRVMNALRIPTSDTSQTPRVQALINEAYRDLCNRKDWWWLKKRTVINTTQKVTAGTVSLTQLSTAITFTNVPVDVNSANLNISGFSLIIPAQADDADAVYRINDSYSVGSLNAALDAPYTGLTNTAAGYRLYRDRYQLPVDCSKVLALRRYGEIVPCDRIGTEEMYLIKGTDQTEGRPEMYTVEDFNFTGDPTSGRMLIIHPYPDKPYRMEVVYKQQLNTELTSTTQPFMPDEWRHLLVYGALMIGYPTMLNDMERGTYFASLYEAGLAKMAMEQREYADDRPGIAPNASDYRSRRNRRRASMVSLGSWFDRLPNAP